jgi:hypothetical protein
LVLTAPDREPQTVHCREGFLMRIRCALTCRSGRLMLLVIEALLASNVNALP